MRSRFYEASVLQGFGFVKSRFSEVPVVQVPVLQGLGSRSRYSEVPDLCEVPALCSNLSSMTGMIEP